MSFLNKLKSIFEKKEKINKNSENTKKNKVKKSFQKKDKQTSNKDFKNKKDFNKKKRKDRPRNKTNEQSTGPQPKQVPSYKGKAFSELNLDPRLLKQLNDNDFQFTTEVQEKSIPHSLSGKNIFCSSATGSGKTLSFLLPMIHKFYNGEISQALVICPTREIAIQIQKNLRLFKGPELTSELVIGGTNMDRQKKALKKYPKILIATPGRLLDMLKTGYIWLQYTNYVVLDEADRMLDMGFEEDLIKIHSELSGSHQTLLFSATLFPRIKKMAERYAQNYEEIIIGKPTNVANTVEHVIYETSYKNKIFELKKLIKENDGKIIIFFNTIRETISITNQLEKMGIRNIRCIHSKINQKSRERIIHNFRSGKLKVLLASDVAARGIDIPNVELVINYDIPNNSEEYIHRVGRTGRAGLQGQAISFYTPKDKQRLYAIEKLIKNKIKKKLVQKKHRSSKKNNEQQTTQRSKGSEKHPSRPYRSRSPRKGKKGVVEQ